MDSCGACPLRGPDLSLLVVLVFVLVGLPTQLDSHEFLSGFLLFNFARLASTSTITRVGDSTWLASCKHLKIIN